MAKKKKSEFVETLYVVMNNIGDGDVVPVAFTDIKDIPEDEHGNIVGKYKLLDVLRFDVSKALYK